MFTPVSASASAMPLPIPREPPVINACLLLRLVIAELYHRLLTLTQARIKHLDGFQSGRFSERRTLAVPANDVNVAVRRHCRANGTTCCRHRRQQYPFAPERIVHLYFSGLMAGQERVQASDGVDAPVRR